MSICPAQVGPTLAPRLNEIVAVNQAGLRSGLDERPDWIELFNPTDQAMDLAGWSLSDNPARPRRWRFRSGHLAPGGFLVVFASGADRQPAEAGVREPDTVPGLVSWNRAAALDPSRAAEIRVAGGVAFVRSWPDSRTGAPAFSQTASVRQPRFMVGPDPFLRFDGLDDLLRLPHAGATNSFTLIVVARPSASHENDAASVSGVGGVSGQRWLFGVAHGGDQDAGVGVSLGTNGVAVYEHGSGHMPARAVRIGDFGGAPSVISVVVDGGRPALAIEGALGALGESSNRRQYTSPVELGSGAYGAFQGDVFEIALFNRALPEEERYGVEAALAARHGARIMREWHTDFRLDGDGETLLLADPAGVVVDQVRYPALPADVSWGRRIGDGEVWAYFEAPTPGRANDTPAATRFLESPTFSRPAGFYAAPFELSLGAGGPDAEIRYTLDGAEPTAGSILYRAPIAVVDRSSQANRYSAISTAANWQPPAKPVFKGTVIRARAFATGAIASATATATFYVHPSGRARYRFPVVSLATAPANLFDAQRGIYVAGNAPNGNFSQSGDEWERPVFVEFFETNGTRAIAAPAGVRIHGNTSFQFPVKALRLHALNQGGTGPFRHRIFPEAATERFDRLLLRPSGHDHHLTLMRDGLMQGLAGDLEVDTQRYRPAVVFVNGEYWGLHNLQEAFEKNFFVAHHPTTNPERLDYLEGYAPSPGVYEGSADGYLELVRYLEQHGAASHADLARIGARMDLGSYRDYKIAEIFHYRWDIGNHRFWRPLEPPGRFRWILFDCDVGFGGFWSEANPWAFDMLRAVLEPSGSLHGHNNDTTIFLLKTLLENGDFRSDFILRFADVLNSSFETAQVVARIDRMAAEIASGVQEHTDRWRYPGSVRSWEGSVEALRNFARRRPDAQRTHLQRYFGLDGWVRLTLGSEATGTGSIRCHSLSGLGSSQPWSGLYPMRMPLSLDAVPAPGFRFAGWRELPGVDSSNLRLSLPADTTLTARFEPVAAVRPSLTRIPATGRLELRAQGVPLARLSIERSVDLLTWTPLAEITADAAGAIAWSLDGRAEQQFLRVRPFP